MRLQEGPGRFQPGLVTQTVDLRDDLDPLVAAGLDEFPDLVLGPGSRFFRLDLRMGNEVVVVIDLVNEGIATVLRKDLVNKGLQLRKRLRAGIQDMEPPPGLLGPIGDADLGVISIREFQLGEGLTSVNLATLVLREKERAPGVDFQQIPLAGDRVFWKFAVKAGEKA